jgi:hypothetical protein
LAGFDASFRYTSTDEPTLSSMLAATRRRARVLQVSVQSTVANGGAYIAFNGNTYQLDFLLERMRRDLPTIAEAAPPGRRRPSERRELALGLIDILWRYRLSLYDRYPETWVPTLRRRTKPAYMLPHDLFTHGAPSLQDRLFITMEMLASWHFDEIAPEVLVEEVHTASELLLRRSVKGAEDRQKFPDLVKEARRQELLHSSPERRNLPPKIVKRLPGLSRNEYSDLVQDYGRDLLLELSGVRNSHRHQGIGPDSRAWLSAHFWEITRLLERLSTHAQDE